jgi:hypothetical protein
MNGRQCSSNEKLLLHSVDNLKCDYFFKILGEQESSSPFISGETDVCLGTLILSKVQ